MINGAHMVLYTSDAEADRGFLRDVLKLPNVDAGNGWLIFGLPPSEIAVHPAEASGKQGVYFMCEDIEAFVASMKEHGRPVAEVRDEGWGLLCTVTLPSGSEVGVYQPRHARPDNP